MNGSVVPEPTNYYSQQEQNPEPAQQPQQPTKKQPAKQQKKPPAPRKSRARKGSTIVVATPQETNNTTTAAPGPETQAPLLAPPILAAPPILTAATATSQTHAQTQPQPPNQPQGQVIPKLAYRFADGAFYMQLGADNPARPSSIGSGLYHHKMGRGTDAAELALGRFVRAARERLGVVRCPGDFVFRVWEGVEANLERLEAELGVGLGVVGGYGLGEYGGVM
jgi:hypothetical protein